jgi:crossover junction endodeoxyribonuclease RusA
MSITSMTSDVRVKLDWPAPGLSPNARLHWSRKSRLIKSARKAAWASVLEARGRANALRGERLHLTWTFCPPDRRRRDADNIIASLKAAADGISDALGFDDSKFVSTYQFGEPVKGGAVLVTVRSA